LYLHVSLSLFVFSILSLTPARAKHGLVSFPLRLFLPFGFAPIVEFLAFRYGDLTFRNTVPEVNLGRNDGHSFLLGLDQQAVNFAAVKEQFPFAKRIVIPEAAGLVLRNMAVYQPSLPLANLGIGLAEGPFALSQALHFGSHQY
jgi:hypothetical protein